MVAKKQPSDSRKIVSEIFHFPKKTKQSEFQKLLIVGTFLIWLTQFKKTESIGKIIIPQGNLLIKIHIRN